MTLPWPGNVIVGHVMDVLSSLFLLFFFFFFFWGGGGGGKGGEGAHISVIPTFILPGQFFKTRLSASSLVSRRRGQVLL